MPLITIRADERGATLVLSKESVPVSRHIDQARYSR
jgi:hypothetical protein